MMSRIQHFATCVVLVATVTTGWAADNAAASAEKARKAISVLQSEAPPGQKAMACKQLAIYGSQEAVPALAPLLADKDLASWARIALEAIPGPAADEALRAALAKLQGRLLVGVINSIGVRKDTKALEALTAKLKDADTDVASAAAVALGHIGGDQAVQALEQMLAGAPAKMRPAVAEGFILCAEQYLAAGKTAQAIKVYDTVRKADLPKQNILEATRGAILARQSEGIPLLLETLRSADKAIFGLGLRTARELPGRAATEALAAELDKINSDRQGPLLLALADRGDAAALPAVFAAAKSGSKNLRLAAITVMERLGDASCVPVFLDLSTDNDPDLAKAAKAGLARLPGKEVDAGLAARLPQATGNTRRLLVELAGQRHVTAAVPELVKAAGDTDPVIRAAGVKALGETVGAGDLNTLTDLLAKAKSDEETSTIEAALASACGRSSDKAGCTARLLDALKAANAVPARCALLRVLGTLADAKALEAVQSALASQDAAVNDAAVRVLADWPDAPAFPALYDVFRQTKNGTHRILALRNCVRLLSLGAQSPQQTLKTYGELLSSSQRPDDRKVVLAGLANVADPAALKLVEPLVADPQVHAEAELAMLGIANGLMSTAPAEAKAVATKLQATSKNERTRERAAQILQQADKVEDFITAWQVCGPYTEADQGGPLFDTAFAPEWATSKVSWRPLPSGNQAAKPWMLDLLAAVGGDHRVAYARTYVYSEKAQPARIEFGTDDGNKLWLNGKLVHQVNRGGAANPGDFKPKVDLRQGWNALLLKVIQDTGPWEFCLRIRNPAGEKLDGLRIQSGPPE
jgi:HEAT repeat protein